MHEDDLGLHGNGNYTVQSSALQTATMQTLAFEHLAAQNERIAFIHIYPGLVRTAAFSRGGNSAVGLLMRYIVSPLLMTFFASSAEDVAARVLFYATNERYSVVNGLPANLDGRASEVLDVDYLVSRNPQFST